MRSLSGTFLVDAFTRLEFFDFMGLELRELLVLAGPVTLTRLGKGEEARCFRWSFSIFGNTQALENYTELANSKVKINIGKRIQA